MKRRHDDVEPPVKVETDCWPCICCASFTGGVVLLFHVVAIRRPELILGEWSYEMIREHACKEN